MVVLLVFQPSEQEVQLAWFIRVKRGAAKHVIVSQNVLEIVHEPLCTGVQDEKRITTVIKIVVEPAAVAARTMAPLVAHISADRQIEEHPLGTPADTILGPVVLDFVIVKNHIRWHIPQELPHVGRTEGLDVTVLEFFVRVRQTDAKMPAQQVGVDLVPNHQDEAGGDAVHVVVDLLADRTEDFIRMLGFPKQSWIAA